MVVWAGERQRKKPSGSQSRRGPPQHRDASNYGLLQNIGLTGLILVPEILSRQVYCSRTNCRVCEVLRLRELFPDLSSHPLEVNTLAGVFLLRIFPHCGLRSLEKTEKSLLTLRAMTR